MNIDYKWEISLLRTYPEYQGYNSVVFSVDWKLVATNLDWVGPYDGLSQQNVDIISRTSDLSLNDLSNFTNFSDLTEPQVLGWIQAKMGSQWIEEAKQGQAERLQLKAQPKEVMKLPPWLNLN